MAGAATATLLTKGCISMQAGLCTRRIATTSGRFASHLRLAQSVQALVQHALLSCSCSMGLPTPSGSAQATRSFMNGGHLTPISPAIQVNDLDLHMVTDGPAVAPGKQELIVSARLHQTFCHAHRVATPHDPKTETLAPLCD